MENTLKLTKLHSLVKEIKLTDIDIYEVFKINKDNNLDPDLNISTSMLNELFRQIKMRMNDPFFVLNSANNLNQNFSSVLGVLLSSCNNLEEALRNFCLYEKVVDRTSNTSYLIHDNKVDLFIDFNRSWVDIPVSYMEFKVLGFISYIKKLINNDRVKPLEVHFIHHPLLSITEYSKFFDTKLYFNNKRVKISFNKDILEKEIIEPNLLLKNMMIKESQKLLTSNDQQPYNIQIKNILEFVDLRLLPSLNEVAKNLGLSPRVLQNKLKSENISYTEILNKVKKDKATEFLKNPMNTIDEVAYLLGFSERSSFDRSFKLWMNVTPKEYRKFNN